VAAAVVWDGDQAVLLEAAPRVIIDAERCKGCQLCLAVCPPAVLGIGPLNRHGYHAAVLLDNARCTSCTACALICPEGAITVFRPRRPPREARPPRPAPDRAARDDAAGGRTPEIAA
jgi:2-oxoglutarate ferredoxin oxidoreductase subunit delta